ncbi:hypothetical protein NQ314_015662 [Rhamnusium bicolor]|uniref:Rhodanese domain-containing protein n=1 Tax=Rhamnusium bicolor TaxID=1586634 RepID=A0AAV8WY34_9CUCU|nr:hypothetical protein NQ314_015662 [Rhamnusium bicolor]
MSDTDKVVRFADMRKFENKGNVLIIDVREPKEIAETGKIGGSINIPLANLENALKTLTDDEFNEKYGKPKPALDFPLIFSCKMGGRACKAMDIAIQLGFKNAKYYKGSWTEWEQKLKEN